MKADERRALERALDQLDANVRLVFLYGSDDAQVRELAQRFTARLTPADDALGRVDLLPSLLAEDPARLADEAAAVSMFGGTRLIRVDGAEDGCADAVAALMSLPVAGNPVVMTAGDLKPTSKLLKSMASPQALIFRCFVPDARGIAELVANGCAARGLRPTHAALAALVAAYGAERGVLAQELDKLALYLDAAPGSEAQLDVAALEAVGAAMGDGDFSALVDAVMGGDSAAAARQAARLADNGIAGIAQLRALLRRQWQLVEIRAAIDAGAAPRAAVDALRPPVFWKDKDKLAAEAARWPMPRLRRAIARVVEAERQIKMPGRAPEQLLTAQALIGIASFAQGGAARR